MRPLNDLTIENLPSDIQVLGSFDVMNLDSKVQNIYNFFRPFKDFVFENNQRLVVLDYDTDYYPSLDSVGNNIYNILKIVSALDISTDHLTIITSNYGKTRDVEYLCNIFNLRMPKVIETSQWMQVFPSEYVDYTPPDYSKNYLYTCLNGQPRTHRKTLLALLNQYGLLSQGLVSWHTSINPTYRHPLRQTPVPETIESVDSLGAHFRITDKFTRINEELSLCRRSKQLHVESEGLFKNTTHELITGGAQDHQSWWYVDFLHHSLIYLISETVGQSPHQYFSEKTWKAMLSKMPFMLFGVKHSLKKLQEFGFKTFHDFWDESYDNAETSYERAELIVKTLDSLKNKNLTELSQQIQPIVEHNFNHMKTFQSYQIDLLKQM